MSRVFRLQDPGEGIHEAEVVEITVTAGDEVREGQTVMAVETDKATTELPSPYTGRVAAIHVERGAQIKVGDPLMTFSGADEDPQASGSDESGEDHADAPAETATDETGNTEAQPASDAAGGAPARGSEGGPIPAAPSTRRRARELGVGLEAVSPSGPGGRVLTADVEAFAERGTPAGGETEDQPGTADTAESGGALGAPAEPLPDFAQWGEVERVRLRSVRRTTARAMARAWAEIPHVMHHDVVDITELDGFRRTQAHAIEEQGGKLTLTVLVIKAAVAALRAFPRFNASLDAQRDEIVLKHYYHVGVAVDTDRGLMVPVVRDADRKTITELALEVAELAERTRRGEAAREELQGGSFTITNVGGIGGTLFTPIIRHPESAILGLARAELRPLVVGNDDGEIQARLTLPLCLAFDHRVADGAEAAHFVNRIAASLQNPASLLLSV